MIYNSLQNHMGEGMTETETGHKLIIVEAG